jgi:hypothetical protein
MNLGLGKYPEFSPSSGIFKGLKIRQHKIGCGGLDSEDKRGVHIK